jgi:hypothetical protein
VEKLQKAGLWIWQNKEPLVLAIVVLVLCYRGYGVIYPKEIDIDAEMASEADTSRSSQYDEDEQEVAASAAAASQRRKELYEKPGKEPNCDQLEPKDPPPLPMPPEMLAATQFAKENIFTARKDAQRNRSDGVPPPQMTLLDIKEWPDGSYRAQIRTRAKKWYKENEPFESYELQVIDPDGQSITVFSEKHGKPFTFNMKGAG